MTFTSVIAPRDSDVKPPPGTPFRRPRAEDCDRLVAADVRRLIASDAEAYVAPDGTAIALRRRRFRSPIGGDATALRLVCPTCATPRGMLHRPPGQRWQCLKCNPLSYRSHRRPGGKKKGEKKPPRWHTAALAAHQRKTAEKLGIEWPPPSLTWGLEELKATPRHPGAPRLSQERITALRVRLVALEAMRTDAVKQAATRELKDFVWDGFDEDDEDNATRLALAQRALALTRWAMRRPAGTPRSFPAGKGT